MTGPGTTALVVGTGRCGSTLVQEVLAHHRDAAWLSNVDDLLGPTPLRAVGRRARARAGPTVYRHLPRWATAKGRLRFAPTEGWRLLGATVGPTFVTPSRDLTEADADAGTVAALRGVFDRARRDGGRPVLLHKLTGWPRTGVLRAALGPIDVVHVVRDGRAVAGSWLQMSWWRGDLGPDGWHFGPLDDDEQRLWTSRGCSAAALAGLGWARLVDAFAAARADHEAAGGRWLDVRLEDVVSAPAERMAEVAGACGLSPVDPAFTRGVARTPWRVDPRAFERSLDRQAVADVEAVAGEQLARCGYG